MTDTTNVLITGANRGIGKGLLTSYLARPNHKVFAGVRDPTNVSSKALLDLPHATNSKVILVKIVSGSETDALEAVKTFKSHGITKLDIAIANAGIADYWGAARTTPLDAMLEHYKVNVVGPLLLFQAMAEILEAAPKPKFIVISSAVGSIDSQEKIPLESTAYGSSKAAVNFTTRKIHFENPEIIVFPLHPGWLQTDMGNRSAVGVGMEQAPTPLQDGVDGIVKQIDIATRKETSGTFVAFDGEIIPW